MRRIFVIGSANMDTVYSVPHIPAVGETIIALDVMQNPGGKGANQAVASARAGGEVYFTGAVGDDAAGAALRQSLSDAGVDIHLLKKSHFPTGSAFINVSPVGDNNIVVYKGANDDVTESDIDTAIACMESGDICVLQIEIPPTVVWYAVKKAHVAGVMVLLNPSPVTAGDADALHSVDILVPNESEAATLLGVTPTDSALQSYCVKNGIGRIIMTMGDKGVWDVTPDGAHFYICNAVKATDTTGAGDCFLGSLAAALARDDTMDSAIQYAMAASAIAVTRMGAQQGMPSHDEIVAELKLKNN